MPLLPPVAVPFESLLSPVGVPFESLLLPIIGITARIEPQIPDEANFGFAGFRPPPLE